MAKATYQLSKLLNDRPPHRELRFEAPYTEGFLNAKAKQGDDLADRVIDQLNRDGLFRGAWRDVVDIVLKEAKNRGGAYKEFSDFSYRVPDWVDFQLMKPSQRLVFTRLPGGMVTGLATFFGSMLIPSAFSVISQSQMGEDSARLLESSTFILKPALGVEPGTSAHYEIMRVRLIHAIVRYFSEKKRGQLPGDHILGDAAYVNQCQLAYALHIFSYLHLRSAILMGCKLTDEQIISHQHRWRYMGYLLGINKELLPISIEQEKIQCHALMKREVKPELANDWFAKNLEQMLDELTTSKNQKSLKKRYEEFKVILLHCMGEDVLAGWGISTDPVAQKKILRSVKLKIKLMDLIQRQKPFEILQYHLVKRFYLKGNIQSLLKANIAEDPNALGNVEETESRSKHPRMQEFESIVRGMNPT